MAQFYKYDDNPTVYRGSDNYAFSSWDEFTKAGGTSGGIETRARSSTPSGFYVGTPPANNAVTVNQLTPAAPVTLPPVPAKDTSGATAALETGSKSIEQYMKEATAPETETSKQQASYIKDLNILGADLGGKQAALAAEEEKQGVGILQKDLAGLNSQIMQGVAELKQMQDAETKAMVDAEGKVIPIAAISGEQARIQRQQAVLRLTKQSDIGLLQARALGLQGQIESAKATAARAIDLRYEAKEDEYNLKLKQLDLIQPLLDKEQKIQATALERKYQDEMQAIEDQKAQMKNNIGLALGAGITTKYTNLAGTIINTFTGQAFSTPEELFKDAGVSSWAQMNATGQITNYQDAVNKQIMDSRPVSRSSGSSSPSSTSSISSGFVGPIDPRSQNLSPLAQSIISNPALYKTLTPSQRGELLPELQGAGFDVDTLTDRPLSETALKDISQSESAIMNLNELKAKIAGNEQYLGPISGFQKLNPWSDARKVQSDIDRVRQQVGKTLEGGVLRKEDEEKYKKILATLNDTPSTATYKIDALISQIQRDIENYKLLQQQNGRRIPESNSAPSIEDLRSKYNY